MTARRPPDTERRIPLTTDRCSREGSIIRSSNLRSQYDPAALLIAVAPQRDAVRVTPSGELDVANAGALQAQLDELRAAGFAHVVLDLRELTFMDSTGVRLILREDRLARSGGSRFSLIAGNATVQRVLGVCGLADRLDFGAPLKGRARSRHDPARPVDLAAPSLGIAFQSYLAQLRHEGRPTSRLGRGSAGRPQLH
ncbi:MAG TPA: STAS domain-containing protein [Solirubrobacteraceae bacterium]|nr:STAS domain-containing protein [Solirubrobacteraceae bacterium]